MPRRTKSQASNINRLALAKTAPPALTGVHARTRLFRLLDKARKQPIAWIAAPGGAGKTTLLATYLQARKSPVLWYQLDAGDDDVASFFYHMGLAAGVVASRRAGALPLLTREYLTGLSAFTTNYFRELYARLPRGGAIVLDNYQEIASDGQIQDVLREGLTQVPDGINVFVASREEPPAAFARLRAGRQIALIGWEDLRLTERESAAIAKLRGMGGRPSRAALDRLHRDTRGWVAGLVLLTEQGAGARDEPAASEVLTNQSIFDYFASEIFRRSGPEIQAFLLQTALLPKVSASLAGKLTGERDSATILRDLVRRNYFTVQLADGVYEYHPLFRAFLQARAAATYTADEMRSLKQRCAQLLAASGDVEAGIALLQQAEDWSGAAELILKQAPMLIDQGRLQTLTAWLQALPERLRAGNPWLLYWLGVSRLAFSPAEARESFERAYAMFEQGNEAAPLYLAWSGIIDSFIFEFDDLSPMGRWLERYPTLAAGRLPAPRNIEARGIFSYASGLRYHNPEHPDLAVYIEHLEGLFREEADPEQRFVYAATLVLSHLWFGSIERTGNLLEALELQVRAAEIKPLARLYWLLCLVMYCGGTGDSARALRAVTEGLALAEASGIRLLDVSFFIYGTYGQLYAGNVGHARELLRRMSFAVGQRGRGVDAFYHHNASMVLLHEGDATRAVEEGRLCVELSKPLGLYTGVLSGQLNLAYAYAARGDADAALQAATEAYDLANRMRSKLFRSFSRFAEANVWRMRGDRERTLGALDEALTLAFEMGHVTSSACPRDAAAALYAMALDAGIQTDYVRRVIAKTGLPPPADLLPENWPWPIRIYTLGHTSIVKEETPLVFAGKAQKKPLDLLHVLIALGGRDVSVARLANALWPDAEGDMARTALRTTLHRLRRLLGERSIVLQDSTLTLNPEYCWVDVWAFERIGEQADRMRDARRLMALYRGPFLQDDDMPHVVVERERLRARFLQLVERVGQAAEEGGDDETALWLYQAAIEVEPLAESLYRRLMCCHLRLNRPADAVAVYRRCEAALRSLLGVEPSPDTRVLLPCGGRESRRRSN